VLEEAYRKYEGKIDSTLKKQLSKELNLDVHVIYKYFWDMKSKKTMDRATVIE
jgi:hypothetical protein